MDWAPSMCEKCWSEWQDLNLRPPRPERGALPDCATLRPQVRHLYDRLGAASAGQLQSTDTQARAGTQ